MLTAGFNFTGDLLFFSLVADFEFLRWFALPTLSASFGVAAAEDLSGVALAALYLSRYTDNDSD